MVNKGISKRYDGLLLRSFKNDLRLFLLQSFLKGNLLDQPIIDAYSIFNPNENLISQYVSIHHLPKSKDLIPGSNLMVGEYDLYLKSWLINNRAFLNDLKILYSKRFLRFVDFEEFYNSTPKHCYYCRITEEKIEILIANRKLFIKRLSNRGRTLEIDRKNPFSTYTKENLAFCCYWCNNAKTDEFSAEEFIPIGNQIENIWEKRLRKNS